MATARVRSANSASPSVLCPTLPRVIATPQGPILLSLHFAAHLAKSAQDALYALFDSNITPLASGTSMETGEVPKREEMFDPDTRFLVLTRLRTMPGSMPVIKNGQSNGAPSDQNGQCSSSVISIVPATNGDLADKDGTVEIDAADLVGYASFRFDTEETMGPKDVEVVYCYELQLVASARGLGLGALLMTELERIGCERGMRKSMLTCLTGNTTALSFYNKVGYRPDEIDPTRVAEEDGWEDLDENGSETHCDYRILSKVFH